MLGFIDSKTLGLVAADASGKVSDKDIADFVSANMNNPQAIYDAMMQYGVTFFDIARATGYTLQQIGNYVSTAGNRQLNVLFGSTVQLNNGPGSGTIVTNSGGGTVTGGGGVVVTGSGGGSITGTDNNVVVTTVTTNPALTDVTKVTPKKSPVPTGNSQNGQYSLADVQLYVSQNLNDAGAILKLLQEGVTITDIQNAMGYTFQDIANYVSAHQNAELSDRFAAWIRGKTYTPANQPVSGGMAPNTIISSNPNVDANGGGAGTLSPGGVTPGSNPVSADSGMPSWLLPAAAVAGALFFS